MTVDGGIVALTAVAVTDDGKLRAGRTAVDVAQTTPERCVSMPGQLLFEASVDVGSVPVDPVDLTAATLALFAPQVAAVANGGPELVICTPSHWVGRQTERVRVAARRAGLPAPQLIDGADAIVREQLATGATIPVGAMVVVCRLDDTVGEVVLLCRRSDGLERLAMHPLGAIGTSAGVTLVEQAAAGLAEVLASTEVPGDQVAAVFCHVPQHLMTRLGPALTAAGRLQVAPLRVGELTAAMGGLHAAVADRPAKRPWRRVSLVQSLAGVAVGAGGAAMLVYQNFNGSQVYAATSISPRLFVTQWAAWGLAPLLMLLALVAGVHAGADLRRRPGTAQTNARFGSSLLFTAGFGLALAAMLALIGAREFGVRPGQLLTWTIGSTVGTAVTVAIAGLMLSRFPDRVGSRDLLRFPVEAMILATVSTVVVVGSYVGIPIGDSHAWWTMEHAGAIGMGWAVAYLLTRRPARLVALGLLLGGPATYAISLDTVDAIGAFLIAAISLWWLVALGRLVAPLIVTLARSAASQQPDQPGTA